MKVKSESEVAQSCPTLATPWTATYQAPPSMQFSRQKYWSGVPSPSPVFNLNYLFKGPVSKYSHTGMLGLQHMNWEGGAVLYDLANDTDKLDFSKFKTFVL